MITAISKKAQAKRLGISVLQIVLVDFVFSCSTSAINDDNSRNADNSRSSATSHAPDKGKGPNNVAEYLLSEQTIDPAIKTFVLRLTKADITKVIDTQHQFVIIRPGPGVQPIYTLAQTQEDLLGLDEVLLMLSDSSALVTMTFYDFKADKCAVLDEFPDGMYIKNFNFADHLDALQSRGDDESFNKEINANLGLLKGENGTELLIRFSDKSMNTLFLDFYIINRNGSYVIACLDQRNCGA